MIQSNVILFPIMLIWCFLKILKKISYEKNQINKKNQNIGITTGLSSKLNFIDQD